MKILILFAVSLVAVLGQFTDEQNVLLNLHKAQCIQETGADPILVENIKRGEFPENDEKLKCFATCILKKTEIMSPDESINVDIIFSKSGSRIPKDKLDKVIADCERATGNSCERGAKIFRCVVGYGIPILQ